MSKEIKNYKKAIGQEKESIIARYNEEIHRRDKHIKMLSESVRNFEIENKHLLEVVYAKEREISQMQSHLGRLLLCISLYKRSIHLTSCLRKRLQVHGE